jgi:hypothetical protein
VRRADATVQVNMPKKLGASTTAIEALQGADLSGKIMISCKF